MASTRLWVRKLGGPSVVCALSYGLAWQARLAAQHGKPISFPEWGLVYYAYSPALSGMDDATFVQNMFAWFKSHNVAFENSFDADVASIGQYYGITTGNGLFPTASALVPEAVHGIGDRKSARAVVRRCAPAEPAQFSSAGARAAGCARRSA